MFESLFEGPANKKKIVELLQAKEDIQQQLFAFAKKTKEQFFQEKVHFRGIIEFSNICDNDCYYCGIGKSSRKSSPYLMTVNEIDEGLSFIRQAGYGSVVFQSGERKDAYFQKYLLDIVAFTKKNYPELGITVSSGEYSKEFYQKLKNFGADRYLLRIETTNQSLYNKLHPQSMSFKNRLQCLDDLLELGFQVGTGVMVGLPGQSINSLANDLLFFSGKKFDMYGLGPYVIHSDTPLASSFSKKSWQKKSKKIYSLTLNFLALLRILTKNANIAAATALDVFDPLGRIKALQIAANIIMPSVTPGKYRKDYLLYDNKPCLDEEPKHCLQCLSHKIKKAGLAAVFHEIGTSLAYIKRIYG